MKKKIEEIQGFGVLYNGKELEHMDSEFGYDFPLITPSVSSANEFMNDLIDERDNKNDVYCIVSITATFEYGLVCTACGQSLPLPKKKGK